MEFRVSAELIVTSEKTTPEELNTRIGVLCDRYWNVGDLRGKTGKRWTTNGWVLKSSVHSDSQATSDLFSMCLDKLLERLKPITAKIRALSAESDVGISVSILASDVPGLGFNHEHLRAMADLGVWLDIDIILSESLVDSATEPCASADNFRVN